MTHHGHLHFSDWAGDLRLEERSAKRRYEDSIEAVLRRYRLRFLARNRTANADLVKLFETFYRDVVAELTRAGVLTSATVTDDMVLAAVSPVVSDLVRDFTRYLQTAVVDTAELTLLREADLLRVVASELPRNVATALATALPRRFMAERIGEILMESTLGSRIRLSDSIWVLGRYAENQVTKVVRTGLLRGDDAIAVAKDLEHVLVPQRGTSVIWHHGNAPGRLKKRISAARQGLRTYKGTVSYRHLTVARSEMFRAQTVAHQANALGMQRLLPFDPVQGMKWNLSNSHPEPDICDTWASADDHGLGAGVYPVGDLPSGHPNEMCFTTSQMVSVAEFKRQMEAWEARLRDQHALLQQIGPDRGLEAARGVLDENVLNALRYYQREAA